MKLEFIKHVTVIRVIFYGKNLLLGLTIDNKLSFEEHIPEICKKASMQLNATCRLQRFMDEKQKELYLFKF